MSDLLTLKEVCHLLSVSTATGRNWIRLEKLVPTKTIGKQTYFSKSYVNRFKKELTTGKNTALKSRRNKRFVTGNGIYRSYISPDSPNTACVCQLFLALSEYDITLTAEQINLLLAECALQLICQRTGLVPPDTDSSMESFLKLYVTKQLCVEQYTSLLDDFISCGNSALTFIAEYPTLFDISYKYVPSEDILGLLYISLKNMTSRKATGSYYTPTETVLHLIRHLVDTPKNLLGKQILDPCCGTGNFLLQLPDTLDFSQVHGNDIDPVSVTITRLNMALKFQVEDMALLYQNITVSDFLTTQAHPSYDFIIGNPPWGYSYSKDEKRQLCEAYQCANGNCVESYDLFTERAISLLKENGTLAFVVPKAILNVKSHTAIREFMLKETLISRLDFLGDTFDNVQCPSIILQLVRTSKVHTCIGMTVSDPNGSFVIQKERSLTSDCFSLFITDSEYDVLEKIKNHPHHTTLKNQADFALGIVTGDNKKYVSHRKTSNNEIILKGADIKRYQIQKSENYITFHPERFQQVAKEKYYRAPEKLVYPFICKHPIFAYDNGQHLSLNSCNLIIPHIDGLDIKYILAVLNSRITAFLFAKQFDSVKVLRSHIEQIPIPIISFNEQKEILPLVNELLTEQDSVTFQLKYDALDKMIANLFGLTEADYEIVCNL